MRVPTVLSILLVVILPVISICAHLEKDQIADLSRYEGLTVGRIVVDNRNIYDVENPRYSNFLFRAANKLHWKTRSYIIKREVLLKEGEPFSAALAEETARNLRGRLSLYDAWVLARPMGDSTIEVTIVTIDQWSLSGGIIYRRDGEEDRLRVGFRERNLLGFDMALSAHYHYEDGKRDFGSLAFVDPRILGHPLRLGVGFSGDPEASVSIVSLGRPIYNQSQRIAFEFIGGSSSGDRQIYQDEYLIAEAPYEAEFFSAAVIFRTGSYINKIDIKPCYSRRVESGDEPMIYSANPSDSDLVWQAAGVDSSYHRIGLGGGYSHLKYVSLSRIDGFGYTEDFRLGLSALVDISHAFNGDSAVFNHFSVAAANGVYYKEILLGISASYTAWYHRGRQARRTYRFSTVGYRHVSEWATLALRGEFVQDDQKDNANPLILGGTTGIRGHNKYFKTGNRRVVFNFETRMIPEVELLSIRFGATAFADFGRTWKAEDSFDFDRFNYSVGVGLRVSGERSSKSALGRLDISYSPDSGWQVSVGSGQYFGSSASFLPLTTY